MLLLSVTSHQGLTKQDAIISHHLTKHCSAVNHAKTVMMTGISNFNKYLLYLTEITPFRSNIKPALSPGLSRVMIVLGRRPFGEVILISSISAEG